MFSEISAFLTKHYNTSVNLCEKGVKFFLIFQFTVSTLICFGQTINTDNIPKLYNLNNDSIDAVEVLNHTLNVVFFISPECPACLRYVLRIKNTISDYKSSDVNFIGIVPGTLFSQNEIKKYEENFSGTLDIYIDKQYHFTRSLNATITPQVFMIDHEKVILYSGMIDNWFYKPGKARKNTTEFYLKDNLNSYLSGNGILHKNNQPIGCYIF